MSSAVSLLIAAVLCVLFVAYGLDSTARRGRLAPGIRPATIAGAQAGLGTMLGLIIASVLIPYLARLLGSARPPLSHPASWWMQAILSSALFGVVVGAATGAVMASWLDRRSSSRAATPSI